MRKLLLLTALVLLMMILFIVLPVLRPLDTEGLAQTIQRAAPMLAVVPEGAGDVLIAPYAGPVYWRLRRHRISSEAVRNWELESGGQLLPWLLGRAPAVLWRDDEQYGLIADTDPFRELLLRLFGRGLDVRVENGLVIRGPAGSGFSVPSPGGSPAGHLFILHGTAGSGLTLLSLPAVTTMVINDRIEIHSRSVRPIDGSETLRPELARLPRKAILSAAFASPPDLIRRIEQTLPVEISPLLQHGGKLALYRLHDERLLPRPRGVVILPVDDQGFPELRRRLEKLSPELPFRIAEQSRRMVMGQEVIRRESFGFTLEYTRRGDELLVAFDKTSLETFLGDEVTAVNGEEGRMVWCSRIDAQQLLPALQRMKEHVGLRLLLPELGRALDRFQQTVRPLSGAGEIVAVKRLVDGAERLDVTIRSPK